MDDRRDGAALGGGRPRLRWRRTWPDGEPDDFTAHDPDRPMMHARIYRSRVPAQVGGEWSWAVGEQSNLGTGTAETVRAAALAAEAAWFAHRDGDPPSPTATPAPRPPSRS